MLLFITLGFFDILDILIVAFILFQVYRLVKGTAAINILAGILTFYLAWLVLSALNMKLISTILGQFISVGVIALLIVFQQEVRRFLLLVGSRYNLQNIFNINCIFGSGFGVVSGDTLYKISFLGIDTANDDVAVSHIQC